jgi:hypothetical protein
MAGIKQLRVEDLIIPIKANLPLPTGASEFALGATSAGIGYVKADASEVTFVDSLNAAGYGLSAPVAAVGVVVNSATFALSVANRGIINLTGDIGGRKITSFTGGINGQIFVLNFGDGNVTVGTAAGLLRGNVDFLGANGDQLVFRVNGTNAAETGRQQQSGLNGVLGAQTPAAASVTTLNASGAATLTGGVAQVTDPAGFANRQPASVTDGTDTTPANNTQFLTSIFIPANKTITGIGFLIGSVGGTDKVYAALYDAAGNLLGNSSVAGGGATVGTTAQTQELALTAPVAVKGPNGFYIGISINGNTSRLRTVPAYLRAGMSAGSVTQTHGTVAAVVAPVTFTPDKAPICYVY